MLIDLSHTIKTDMPQWRGDNQPLKLIRLSEHGQDSHMSSAVQFGCHIGTHIDGPLHFLAGQPGMDQMPINNFVGSGLVISLPQTDDAYKITPADIAGLDFTKIDFVLFHTGWDRFWGSAAYYQNWPWLSAEVATILAESSILGVGLDTPSLDKYAGNIAHDICAAAGMINIENLTNLGALPADGFRFMALPLKLSETEASPVRAVAIVNS